MSWRKNGHRSGMATTEIRHAAIMIESASKDEAIGKLTRFARRLYPTSDGYESHSVVVQDATVSDPDAVNYAPQM